ncbi:protein of unknown function [Paraburkholderia kururiensis]
MGQEPQVFPVRKDAHGERSRNELPDRSNTTTNHNGKPEPSGNCAQFPLRQGHGPYMSRGIRHTRPVLF